MSTQKKYISMLSNGTAYSNSFNSSPQLQSQNKVQKVFCNCYKKLSNKCFMRFSKDFNKSQSRIWHKGQAAEIALHVTGNQDIADIDMCD